MTQAILDTFGLTEADRLGSGWESLIYALSDTQILRLPHPDPAAERLLRQKSAFTASLPPLPFAVPQVRKVSTIDGRLVVIEDRIEGRSLADMLPSLTGDRRRQALTALLATAEAMSTVKATGHDYGDLLMDKPLRTKHWPDYLIARIAPALHDPVLAADVPGLSSIAERLIRRLKTLPDPAPCVVHGDIHPPNIMMNDALEVTGLIDFSFTTRVGDHLMDLAGVAHYLKLNNPHAAEDFAFVMSHITRRHGQTATDRIPLYATWSAFTYAYNHDDPVVYPWCVDLIRGFAE